MCVWVCTGGAGTPGVLLGTHPGRALPSSSVALHTHTHTHSDGGDCCDRWLLLSKSFPIKEKKSEILVGLKVLLHEEKKKSQNPLFFTFSVISS